MKHNLTFSVKFIVMAICLMSLANALRMFATGDLLKSIIKQYKI